MHLVTRKVVATAQMGLSVLFIGVYFYTLHDFIHGQISVPVEWKDTIQALLSVLTASVLTIINFWFSRSRPQDRDEQ
jgi:ABC-type anion transport system duplicated permease subunit